MIKECVILNGEVINIGPWDYRMQSFEISPPVLDEEGNVIEDAVYEDRPTNPLPDGAEIVEMEIVEGPDGGLYPVDKLPGPSVIEQRVSQLESESVETMLGLSEVYETTTDALADREQETVDTMLGLAEAYDIILMQQATIDALSARVTALEGGES